MNDTPAAAWTFADAQRDMRTACFDGAPGPLASAADWTAAGLTSLLERAVWGRVALLAWFGVLLQLVLSLRLAARNGQSVTQGLVACFGYFTVLTNLLVAASASACSARQTPAGRLGAAGETLVGAFGRDVDFASQGAVHVHAGDRLFRSDFD